MKKKTKIILTSVICGSVVVGAISGGVAQLIQNNKKENVKLNNDLINIDNSSIETRSNKMQGMIELLNDEDLINKELYSYTKSGNRNVVNFKNAKFSHLYNYEFNNQKNNLVLKSKELSKPMLATQNQLNATLNVYQSFDSYNTNKYSNPNKLNGTISALVNTVDGRYIDYYSGSEKNYYDSLLTFNNRFKKEDIRDKLIGLGDSAIFSVVPDRRTNNISSGELCGHTKYFANDVWAYKWKSRILNGFAKPNVGASGDEWIGGSWYNYKYKPTGLIDYHINENPKTGPFYEKEHKDDGNRPITWGYPKVNRYEMKDKWISWYGNYEYYDFNSFKDIEKHKIYRYNPFLEKYKNQKTVDAVSNNNLYNNSYGILKSFKDDWKNEVNKILNTEKTIQNKSFSYNGYDFNDFGTKWYWDNTHVENNKHSFGYRVSLFNGNYEGSDNEYGYRSLNMNKADSIHVTQKHGMSSSWVYGNQNLSQRIENIDVDFSKLIEIDFEKSDGLYQKDGNIFKESPKMYFRFNRELMTALYESAKIAELVNDVILKDIKLNGESGNLKNLLRSEKWINNFALMVNDLYNKKLSYKNFKKYLENWNEDMTAKADYLISYSKSMIDAEYDKVLRENNWDNKASSDVNGINNKVEKMLKQLGEIANWGFAWNYVLPTVLANDIFVETEVEEFSPNISESAREGIKKNKVKVWDGKSLSWSPMTFEGADYQKMNLNNIVKYKINNIYLGRDEVVKQSNRKESWELGVGKNKDNNTLNFKNICENSKDKFVKNRNFEFNVNDGTMSVYFGYNPHNYYEDGQKINDGTREFTDWNVSVSEVVDNVNDPKYQEEIRKKINENLVLPKNVFEDYHKDNLTEEEKRNYLWVSEPIKLSVDHLKEIKTEATSQINSINYSKLEKFIKLQTNYLNKKIFENKDEKVFEKEFNEYINSKYELNNLGYIYYRVETELNLEYYYETNSRKDMENMFKNGSLIAGKKEKKRVVQDGQSVVKNNNVYYVQVKTNKKPLSVFRRNNAKYENEMGIRQFLKINSETDTQNEQEILKLKDEVLNNKEEIQKIVNETKALSGEFFEKTELYKALIEEKSKIFRTLLRQKLDNETKQKIRNIEKTISEKVKETKQKVNDYKKTIDWKWNGMFDKIDTSVSLKNEFNDLINMFDNLEQEYIKVVSEFDKNLTDEIDYVKQNEKLFKLENETKQLNENIKNTIEMIEKKKTDINEIKKVLNKIDKLEGKEKVKIEFDIQKMYEVAGWNWDKLENKTKELIENQKFFKEVFYCSIKEATREINKILKDNQLMFRIDENENIFENNFVDENTEYRNIMYDEIKKTPVISGYKKFMAQKIQRMTPNKLFYEIDKIYDTLTQYVKMLDITELKKVNQEIDEIFNKNEWYTNIKIIQDIRNYKNEILEKDDFLFTKQERVSPLTVSLISVAGAVTIITTIVVVTMKKRRKNKAKFLSVQDNENDIVLNLNTEIGIDG